MTAQRILTLARRELGTAEAPPGSNRVKYNTAYYGRPVSGDAYPWCVAFLWWLFREAGVPELFYAGGKTASCGALRSWARRQGQFAETAFRPGDIVFYRFSGSGGPQHAGILETLRPDGKLVTIEGNTGTANDADGGQVQRRVRSPRLAMGAFRPRYQEEETRPMTYAYLADVPETYRPAVDALLRAAILRGDGASGPQGSRIDLSREQLRTLTLVYRGGGFDRALKKAGLPPAVPD